MLDKLISHYASRRHNDADVNYQPEEAINRKSLVNLSGKYLTVLLPPWHGGGSVYDILTQRLVAKGSAIMKYGFHGQILQASTGSVIKSFTAIQQSVANDIGNLVAEHKYTAVDFIASSLGNVSLCLIASEYKEFRKATMVVAGSNLARSTWEGSRTQGLRAQFEAQNISELTLDKAWEQLAPKYHAAAFTDKPVQLYVSSTDTIIPTRYQEEMVRALEGAGAIVDVHHSNKGHVASIACYCLRGKV